MTVLALFVRGLILKVGDGIQEAVRRTSTQSLGVVNLGGKMRRIWPSHWFKAVGRVWVGVRYLCYPISKTKPTSYYFLNNKPYQTFSQS
jgi:hypothetical protein